MGSSLGFLNYAPFFHHSAAKHLFLTDRVSSAAKQNAVCGPADAPLETDQKANLSLILVNNEAS